MLTAIIHGFSLGLIICVLIGPVFFALMGVALNYSKRAAIWFVLGVCLSDCIYAMAAFLGASFFQLSHPMKRWMGICGGIVFMVMGIGMIKRTIQHQKRKNIELHLKKHPHGLSFMGQGFIINVLNPGVIAFRIGAVGTAFSTLGRKHLVFIFLVTALITIIGTDLIKISIAELLKAKLQGKVLHRLNLITGSVLIVAGLAVVITTLFIHHL